MAFVQGSNGTHQPSTFTLALQSSERFPFFAPPPPEGGYDFSDGCSNNNNRANTTTNIVPASVPATQTGGNSAASSTMSSPNVNSWPTPAGATGNGDVLRGGPSNASYSVSTPSAPGSNNNANRVLFPVTPAPDGVTGNGAAAATVVSPLALANSSRPRTTTAGFFPMYTSNPASGSLVGQRVQPVMAPGLLLAALENGTPMEVDAAPALPKYNRKFIDPTSCANFHSLTFPIYSVSVMVQGANGMVRFDNAHWYSKCEDKAVTSMGLFYTDKSNGDDKAVKKAVATFLDEKSLKEVADDLVTFAVKENYVSYTAAFCNRTARQRMTRHLCDTFLTPKLSAWLTIRTFQTALIDGFADPKAVQERYQTRQNLQQQFWTEMQNNSAVSDSELKMQQLNQTWAAVQANTEALTRQNEVLAKTVEKQSGDNAANTAVMAKTVEKQSGDNAANTAVMAKTMETNTAVMAKTMDKQSETMEKQSRDNAANTAVMAKTIEKVMLAALEAMSSQKRSRSEEEDTSDDSEKDGVSEPAAHPSKKRRV